MSFHRVDADLITPGCTIFALDLDADTDADADQVQGGTVVTIATHADTNTGELQRRFTVAKQWRGGVRWSVLRADQIRQVEPYNSANVRRLIRALARQVGQRKTALDTDDLQAIAGMNALTQETHT